MMRALADTWTLAKRGLRHITRSPDTIITVLVMPIAIMLLFVYVLGGALAHQTGSVSYTTFIVHGAFSYVLILLIFISPSFVPTDSMTPLLRGFAENQPMTPVVETMRSLLVNGTAGSKVWTALAWILGILVVFYLLSVAIYRRKSIVAYA
jgi:ABC-type polysaccharide/polyol phosphate export permease